MKSEKNNSNLITALVLGAAGLTIYLVGAFSGNLLKKSSLCKAPAQKSKSSPPRPFTAVKQVSSRFTATDVSGAKKDKPAITLSSSKENNTDDMHAVPEIFLPEAKHTSENERTLDKTSFSERKERENSETAVFTGVETNDLAHEESLPPLSFSLDADISSEPVPLIELTNDDDALCDFSMSSESESAPFFFEDIKSDALSEEVFKDEERESEKGPTLCKIPNPFEIMLGDEDDGRDFLAPDASFLGLKTSGEY